MHQRDLGFGEIAKLLQHHGPPRPPRVLVAPTLEPCVHYMVQTDTGRLRYRFIGMSGKGYQFGGANGALYLDRHTAAMWYAEGRIKLAGVEDEIPHAEVQ